MSSYAVRRVALGAALFCVTGLVPAQSPAAIEAAIEQLGSESPVEHPATTEHRPTNSAPIRTPIRSVPPPDMPARH